MAFKIRFDGLPRRRDGDRKYFNEIVAELRASSRGTPRAEILRWLKMLHGYLSSPTGGGVRHGVDLAEASASADLMSGGGAPTVSAIAYGGAGGAGSGPGSSGGAGGGAAATASLANASGGNGFVTAEAHGGDGLPARTAARERR